MADTFDPPSGVAASLSDGVAVARRLPLVGVESPAGVELHLNLLARPATRESSAGMRRITVRPDASEGCEEERGGVYVQVTRARPAEGVRRERGQGRRSQARTWAAGSQ